MIISHKHKYVFIQIEKTASSAMAKELCTNYNGKHILWKHASYDDFLKKANNLEKKYFSFAGVRNPLDTAVSRYHLRKEGIGSKHCKINRNMRNFISENDADFNAYFLKFYDRNIGNERSMIDLMKIDKIYYYENLDDDFENILNEIGLKKKRLVPIVNKTTGKNSDFKNYYSKKCQKVSKIIYSDYMEKFAYEFPEGWAKPNLLEYIYYKSRFNVRFFTYRMIKFFRGLLN